MEQSLINKGYEIVSGEEKADIYIINTCSVTNIAERKSRQYLRRAKTLNPHSIVIACGCYAQVAKEELSKIKEVDLILGINEKNKIVEILEEYLNKSSVDKNIGKSTSKDINANDDVKQNVNNNINMIVNQNVNSNMNVNSNAKKNIKQSIGQDINQNANENINKDANLTENKNANSNINANPNTNTNLKVTDVMNKDRYEEFGTITYTENTRAVIKIQDGCDRFCTYCIIPYARGKVRSREPENIISEIKEIAKKGIKEVVLTGIHIASYGKDFDEKKIETYRKLYGYSADYEKFNPREDLKTGGFRLIELLEQINKIDDLCRIRLGSIEPKLITEGFVKRISKLEKICHHFHLSLQSGCDETLKRMNRRYTTEEFEDSCKLLREVYEDVAITTDVIVGFPNETDEEFQETYDFLNKIKFYKMHVFKYSPKKGTVAEKMDNQIEGNIKEMRSQKLIELSNKNQVEFNKKYIGKELQVLFEEKGEDGYYKGHTGNYMLVKVKTNKHLENIISNVKITKTDNLELIGIVQN